MDKKLLFDYNEKPKKGLWLLLSFQHVFAMFSATVLVPMLTGLPISVALFSSGVGTLIYILCTKGKVPIYLGSSFAYISYIIAAAAMTGDFGAALTGIVIVGIIYCIVALVIKLVGTGWLKKLLPPIVIGPMIMVIGLSLSSVAVAQSGLIEGGSWYSIVVA
ncbi:uracil permease, partial [bacterium]|nr:uracil permease [bacterium]